MRVIKDPPGQTHSPARSDHYSHLKFVLFCEMLKSGYVRTDNSCDFEKWDGQTLCIKIFTSTGRDCGSAEWINMQKKAMSMT